MKKFRISILAAVIAVLAAATVASATATTKIAFTGKYTGQASTKVDGNVVDISATGTGSGTLMGATKLSGAGSGHVFSLKGYLTVTKATGKLARAKGKLKFTGVYDRDDGTFSVKFTGTLTK